MKINDLVNTCIHNLFRHKSRTILTVLGVIIGCCSVVVMISFSIAMRISQDAMLADMGDLSIINIYNNGEKAKLTDSAIDGIGNIENVLAVNPKSNLDSVSFYITAGTDKRFKANWVSTFGIKKDAIETFDYEITEGRCFSGVSTGNCIEVLAGKYFVYNFRDTQRPEGSNFIDYWSYAYGENPEEIPKPYVNPFNTEFEITLGSSGYEEDLESTEKTITYKFKIVGILAEDTSKGYETLEGLMFNADDIKKMLKEYNQLNNIPQKGQVSYNEADVKVNDIENVADVEKKIKDMGFYTNSLESIREPMEKDIRQKQLMFGGLGVVSLFVAALGIMNTMIMAISERKKEIGLMKALGCFVNDIRLMFLMEAGFIGLLGGIIGSFTSFGISAAINLVSTEIEITDFDTLYQVLFVNTDRISVIPIWLFLSSILFSVFVGVISGYYPANSAIKISALDAIKSE